MNRLVIVTIVLTVLAGPVLAQEPSLENTVAVRVKNADKKNYLSLSVENDNLGGGTDRFYTSGVRLTWFNVNTPVPKVIDDYAELIPTFDLNDTTSTFFTLGQNIYTPENITTAAAQPDDRPWAAFLYGTLGLVTLDDNHLDELEVTLGIVGPEALGEQTQKFVHSHISNSPTPKGWKNQLDFEPGLVLSWRRRWPSLWATDFGDYRLRVEPNFNISLGNIYTHTGAGMVFAFGPYQGYLQDTPPRVPPAMPGTGYFETPDQGWSWYTFAGVSGRAVARNIFLDGNSFRDGPDINKKSFVGDATAGIAFTLDDYRLSYAVNLRSREFSGQDEESIYGSITLSTRF